MEAPQPTGDGLLLLAGKLDDSKFGTGRIESSSFGKATKINLSKIGRAQRDELNIFVATAYITHMCNCVWEFSPNIHEIRTKGPPNQLT